MAKLLIIDDDPKICQFLSLLAKGMGHAATTAQTLEHGLNLAQAGEYDLILLDLQFPEGNGLDILPDLLKTTSQPEVIIITGSGVQGAKLAFKHRAWDYVQKPFLREEILLPIARALQYRREKAAVGMPMAMKRAGIIGRSPGLNDCLELVAKASLTDASVLITGETGTGKELFARAVHENSKRSSRNFIVVDCGSLPETLTESILFGHAKGAFTGADKKRQGLVEQAEGGTLFLDEIGDLPYAIQKTLLRALQEKRIRPLGSEQEVAVDFRLVAATHRDLNTMVAENTFREDLLYRLRAIGINLPPLRERREDIQEIAIQKTQRLCQQYGMEIKGISQEFLAVLTCQDWPGNVRELINVLEHALATAGHDPVLIPKHLPAHYRISSLKAETGKEDDRPTLAQPAEGTKDELPSLATYRLSIEKQYLIELLEKAQGDRVKACTISGLSQSTLYTLLSKHNLSRFRS